ncbi:MAG: signal peptidase II [Chlamydiales bacterium]
MQEFIKSYGRTASLLLLGLALLFIDFFTKAYIYNLVPLSRPVFQNFLGGIDFYFSLTFNKGAAWGLFSNFRYLLVAVRIAVIVGLFVYLFFRCDNRKMDAPLVLVLAGAIGNIVDFFLYGYVVDFLHFRFFGHSFAVFNIADALISIGVAWLFLLFLFTKKKKPDVSL